MSKCFPCPVTTVFSRRVAPGSEAAYEQWLRGINQASARFPGNQGTTVIRPAGDHREYAAIVQFDKTENLQRWMDSQERAEWLQKLGAITLDSEEIESMTGMERWFTLPDRSITQAPPKHKMAALLVLGLYPVVMAMNWMLSPLTSMLPTPVRTLVSLVLTVPIMVWLVMPWLTRLFFGWLYPQDGDQR